MPKVTFIQPDGEQHTVTAPENHSIAQIARQNAIPGIDAICGGSVACATCHIYIHPDWVERVTAQDNEQSAEEIDMLDMAYAITNTSRLGCQIIVTKELDGLIVALPGTEAKYLHYFK